MLTTRYAGRSVGSGVGRSGRTSRYAGRSITLDPERGAKERELCREVECAGEGRRNANTRAGGRVGTGGTMSTAANRGGGGGCDEQRRIKGPLPPKYMT